MSVAVFIPTCAIPSHPETWLIESVMSAVRFHLPDARIYIGADGIAPYAKEIHGREEKYNQFVINCQECIATGLWQNVVFRKFHERSHQTQMARWALEETDAEFFIFQEHDCPLRIDRSIHWDVIFDLLKSKEANIVRFAWHPEGVYHEHSHLTVREFEHQGVQFAQTLQWSGWPHVSTTEFYRKMMSEKVPYRPDMIEHCVDGSALVDPDYYKIAMYLPGDEQYRFHHKDGRTDRDTGVRDVRD